MNKNGFDTEDLSLTLARFDSKRRNIVFDETELKRKVSEHVEFSSATSSCGKKVLRGVASLVSATHSQIEEAHDELNSDGWKNGAQGYGYYRNGIKD